MSCDVCKDEMEKIMTDTWKTDCFVGWNIKFHNDILVLNILAFQVNEFIIYLYSNLDVKFLKLVYFKNYVLYC